jgi:Putative adhesin
MFPGLKPVLIASALIGFVMPATHGTAKEYARVTEQGRKVEPGSRIVVRNEFGEIRIEGSDRNTVEAVATERNSSQPVPVSITEASSGNKKVFTVSPVESGRGVGQKVDILLEVKVPHDVELAPIYIRRGSIRINDLDGGANLRTDAGSITVNRVGSPGGGLTDVTTGSGNVYLSNINGDVRIVAISSSISVKCVKGDVAARVASGQIAVLDIGGDVELNNSSGSLSFTGAINSESRYRLKTLSGDVYMDIPDTVGFTAVLSAYSGQIHTEFQFQKDAQTPPNTTGRRIIGKYGDGRGRIDLDSFSGEVFLRKATASSGTDCPR